MRVVAKRTLREFWERYADSKAALESWYKEAKKATWQSPQEVKKEYPSASIIEGNRVIFNIKGNHYRLIVKINYPFQIVWIRFIGTHAEYDKIDAKTV